MDGDLNWRFLGLRIRWVAGPGTPLRIRFCHDAYFRAWLTVNPDAAVARDEQPASWAGDASRARR
jgi:hypothetical protein